MKTTLRVPPPFSLAATLDSHGWLWTHPFHPEPRRQPPRLVRIERIRGVTRRLVITEAKGQGDHTVLRVTSDAPDRDRETVRARVQTMLGLDEDLSSFYQMAETEPRLRGVLEHGAGRTCRGTSLWEDITKGIIQTNIQWRQALRCMAVVCGYGPRHAATGLHAWPGPERLREIGAKRLRDEARVGYRADALIQLADEVAAGERDLDELERAAPRMDTDTLVKALQTVRGIGPATAHAIAGFLGKHDMVSVDSSTIAYVARHYPDAYAGDRPTPQEARAVFDRYGKWAGKAWWYEAWLARHMAVGPLDPRA